MVTRLERNQRRSQSGVLQFDLVLAMAILAVGLIPLAFSIHKERKICQSLYYRGVAMSIVDTEIEILGAGEWKAFSVGEHDYPVGAGAAKALPQGRFVLTRAEGFVRLEWRPVGSVTGGKISRQIRLDQQ